MKELSSDTSSAKVEGRSGASMAAVFVVAAALTVPLLVPPPRPALARAAPSPSPSASPAVSPSAAPSGTPGASSPSPLPSGGASPSPSASPAGPTEEQKRIHAIVERMDHLNPDLKDYQAELAITVDIKAGILRLPMDLQGTSYYKQPDKYKVELTNAPALLQKYPQIFGYHPVDPTEFTISLRPDEVVDHRPCWVLRLDKKSATSDFRGQTVWVDKQDFSSPRRVYEYTNNGRIDVRFKWRKEQGFLVIDRAEGELNFPKFSASANLVGTYRGYRINSGLDDQIFQQKK